MYIRPPCVAALEGKHAKHTRQGVQSRRLHRTGLFAAAGHEEQVAKVVEITHVKEYHDEGERVA